MKIHPEYSRLNMKVAEAAGAYHNAKEALNRLRSLKQPQVWMIAVLEGIIRRTEGLSKELAAFRDQFWCVKEMEPIDGNLLPPIGSQVLIHLNSRNDWVEHTVTGYYVWGDLGGNDSLHRVFVRVIDPEGTPNARMLKDVRPILAKEAA